MDKKNKIINTLIGLLIVGIAFAAIYGVFRIMFDYYTGMAP